MSKPDFIGAADGSVVKYEPVRVQAHKPTAPLTRHQRATLYFKAVRCAGQLLQEVGFCPLADCGPTAFSLEFGHFLLEMAVKEAPRVAHVTSYPGYVYDPERIRAQVTMLTPGAGQEYVIQAVGTFRGRTLAPVFIVVRPDSPDPLREAFVNVLLTTRDLLSRDPALLARIQEALSRRDLNQDLDRLRSNLDRQLEAGGYPSALPITP
jgi:hypothetical protein